jgi:hypothetical protein
LQFSSAGAWPSLLNDYDGAYDVNHSITYPLSIMSTLPEYSPSPPAPSYSKEVGPSEVVLSSTPIERNGYMNYPRGTYLYMSRKGAVILRNQENGRSQPSYGPHSSHIFGSVAIAARDNIEVVRFRVELALRCLRNSNIGHIFRFLRL